MHLRVGDGRVSAYLEVEGAKGEASLAFCSPQDQFNRKIGRNIAEGRMRNRPNGEQFAPIIAGPKYYLEFDIPDGVSFKLAFRTALTHYLYSPPVRLPGWTKNTPLIGRMGA